ncbi:hypothetical protein L2D01_11490 [Hyphomonadaceae bacterium ML37]|nr:hypothetical protein L2D01_11490 [Hyphomonadaceae bacterium ML37]
MVSTLTKTLKVMLIAAAVTLVAGCESMITGGPLIRPGEPTGVIEVVNNSGRTINAVAISSCSASTYGLNRLPSGVSIPHGRSYAFTVSAGCWDVLAGIYNADFSHADTRRRITVAPNMRFRFNVNDGR